MTGRSSDDKFRLIDQVVPDFDEYGSISGVLTTTFDLNPEFFETDFLPSLLGLGAWNDRAWASRIAMERRLAFMAETTTVVMQADRYQGRPRSLRVSLVPYVSVGGRVLHAKVTVIVYEAAIRMLVGSANLTPDGYRHNREVAVSILATKSQPEHTGLIHAALAEMPTVLGRWWTPEAAALRPKSLGLLESWGLPKNDEVQFLWGGGSNPLYRRFLAEWPQDEPILRITVVSPFWSKHIEGGPIGRFLNGLAERGALDMDTELHLITQARPDAESRWVPEFPQGYGTFDFSKLGVTAIGYAADPFVPPEDVGMRSDFTGTRRLHAKIVLLEGESTALAYLGSANFTARGWGFLASPQGANVEAGFMLRRRTDEASLLRSLIPPTTGKPVPLGGAAHISVSIEEEEGVSERPWPSFIGGISIVPSATRSTELELLVRINLREIAGAWKVTLVGEEVEVLMAVEGPEQAESLVRIALTPTQLNTLLKSGEVLVAWWAADEPTRYPINVEAEAREQLPIAPGEDHPGEWMLLAYYQGRIAFEDLYPPPSDWPDGLANEDQPDIEALRSGVDTSRIQSYQIREFVEALQGIRDDLKQAAISEPAMRWALRGQVSPVALAREIHRAVSEGKRSPMGGAFELVELINCLEIARHYEVSDSLREAWQNTVSTAADDIHQWLDDIKEKHAKTLGASFRRYEKGLRQFHRRRELAP